MSEISANRRSCTWLRSVAALGLTVLVVGGAVACRPLPEVPTTARGRIAVTVTHDGQPVDASISLRSGTRLRTVRTGPDGKASALVRPGVWTVHSSAWVAAPNGDPLCSLHLVSDPDPKATVTVNRTTSVAVELQAGPVACA